MREVVALVTNIASPYRFSTWDSLAGKVDELHVLLCAERDPNRIWKVEDLDKYRFRPTVLPGRQVFLSDRDLGLYWNPSIFTYLRQIRPSHIIVTGYEAPTYVAALLYARSLRIPLTIWWGSHALSTRTSRGIIKFAKRMLLGLADSWVTYGTMASEYLISLNFESDRVITGTNCVDPTTVMNLTYQDRLCPSERDRPVEFLFVGQFIERKGVLALLRAFSTLQPGVANLTLVGYGPQEGVLREYVRATGLSNVRFAGPTRSMTETAPYLAAADVLVMPSLLEVWGLVVNEALAAGLYTLSSTYAGATVDLIEKAPYDVGCPIDPTDNESFARVLRETVRLFQQGRVDRNAIRNWGVAQTPERYADALYQAMRVAEVRRTHFGR